MMRLSHPTQVIMKPLYAYNFGCGSTGSGRCFFAPQCEEEERTDVKNGLYFHAWYGISFCVEHMFVGSILNRAAHLPWLDEVNEFTSSRRGQSTSSSCCRRVMLPKGALLAGEENG